jgi:hypothetical protein
MRSSREDQLDVALGELAEQSQLEKRRDFNARLRRAR